jgi:hypothetical protein
MFSFRALGRHLGAASLAGIVAGIVVAGVLGRIAMRVSGFTSRPELIGVETGNGNRVGDITLAGTVGLALLVGIVAGIGGGVLYASAEPWLRSRRWKGAIFGIALLAALGFTVLDPSSSDFKRFGFAPLNVGMFAAMFVVFGVAIAWLFDRIRGAIDGTGPVATVLEIVASLSALGAGAFSALIFLSFGGLDDLVPVMLFAAAALIPPVVRWRGLPRSVGYAAFAIPFTLGTWRTLSGVGQLLG